MDCVHVHYCIEQIFKAPCRNWDRTEGKMTFLFLASAKYQGFKTGYFAMWRRKKKSYFSIHSQQNNNVIMLRVQF